MFAGLPLAERNVEFAEEFLLIAAVAAKLGGTTRYWAVRKSIALLICADLADISASRWYQTRRKFLNFKSGALNHSAGNSTSSRLLQTVRF
jgi:hypothetical protein